MNKGVSTALFILAALFTACGEQTSTQTPDLAPTVESFSADANTITVGQSTTLRWHGVSDGATLDLEPGLGDVTDKAAFSISPTATTTYTLTASNSVGSSSYQQTVTVTPASDPTPNNQAPTATAIEASTPADTALTLYLSGSDEDGDSLSYAVVTEPSYGTLSEVDTGAGTLIYTPQSAYVGADSFKFKVYDGELESAPAMVRLTVSTRAPAFTGIENADLEKTGGTLTFEVSDPDESALTMSVSSSNAEVVTSSGLGATCTDGACSLTVSPLATGNTTLKLTATNVAGYSASTTLELSVFDRVVETLNDEGEGSLRDTLADAAAGDLVGLPESMSGQTLVLETAIDLSKDVTLEGDVTIKSHSGASVFSISEGAAVTLKDLKITSGADAGAGLRALSATGAIYNQGTLVLAGEGSVSGISGASAIVNEGTLTLQDSVSVSANSGGAQGGGIHNSGTLILKNGASVRANSATTGGGVYNSGTLTLQDTASIADNEAATGGGIYNTGLVVIKGDASVSGNDSVTENAYTAGGGIYNDNRAFGEGGVVRLEERARVSANSAPTGGGIYNLYGTLVLSGEASVTANLAVYGAGIYNDEAYLTLEDKATISSNGDANTSLGGGVYAYRGFYDGLDFDGQNGDDNVFANAHSQVYFDYGQNQ